MNDKIKDMDVYSEEFQILFETVLSKFVKEYDDMSQMEVMRLSGELLEAIND